MEQDSSDNASQAGEGFEAQRLSIQKNKQEELSINGNSEEANDLVDDLRPTDLLPRSVFRDIPLTASLSELLITHTFHQPAMLIPMTAQPTVKCKRHASLEEKYKNSQYQLIYSKFPKQHSNNFLHSYFNLVEVLDHSPQHFTTFNGTQQTGSVFDSRFESGNLLYAYKTNSNEYDLILQNDTNTKGYNQWFYFSYEFLSATQTTFNVVSMIKKKTLFEKGVKPSFFVSDSSGDKDRQKQQKQWRQISLEVKYYKNGVHRENGEPYYTLSFKYCPTVASKAFFSLNIPYTYTKLVNLVKELEEFRDNEIIVERKTLCYSLSNNAIPYLIFKSAAHQAERQILFFARQHPGETISSHLMESLLKQLCKNPKVLEKFEIICVPMLNVDGVIYGNFRTNLAGYDINRQWQNTDKWLNPEVHAMKKLLVKNSKIEFVLDLHGHSKKFNSFIYACKQQNTFSEKLFPFLMSRNSLFKVESCTYGLTKDKLSTARAFIRGRGVNHIYTLETSFYGYGSEGEHYRFESKHYDSLGKTVLLALEELYFSKAEELQKHENAIARIVEKQDKQSESKQVDSGSDSNPSEDQLSDNERDKHVIPEKILAEIKEKRSKTKKQKLKKQQKSLRFAEDEKKNSSTRISKRQFHSTQKYEFRKTFENANRQYNRSTKTTINRTLEERSYRTSIKMVRETEKAEQEKKPQIVITKKKSKAPSVTKSVAQSVKEEKKPEKPNLSNLFLSSIQRSSVKTKRVHKSLAEDKEQGQIQRNNRSFLNIDKEKLREQERELEKEREREEREREKEKLLVTANNKESQINSMMADMKNNLKELSKLDKIVEERIREKMSQNLISTIPKSRQSQLNTGVVLDHQSNLLEFRSLMGSTVLMQQSKYESRNESKSKKVRNSKAKKELIFLSELMRPRVQQGKSLNIQIIGNSSQPSAKHKQMYFNQFI